MDDGDFIDSLFLKLIKKGRMCQEQRQHVVLGNRHESTYRIFPFLLLESKTLAEWDQQCRNFFAERYIDMYIESNLIDDLNDELLERQIVAQIGSPVFAILSIVVRPLPSSHFRNQLQETIEPECIDLTAKKKEADDLEFARFLASVFDVESIDPDEIRNGRFASYRRIHVKKIFEHPHIRYLRAFKVCIERLSLPRRPLSSWTFKISCWLRQRPLAPRHRTALRCPAQRAFLTLQFLSP